MSHVRQLRVRRAAMTCPNSAHGKTRIQTEVRQTVNASTNHSGFSRVNGGITTSTRLYSRKPGSDADQAAEHHHLLKRQSSVENCFHLSGDAESGLQPRFQENPQSSYARLPHPDPTPRRRIPHAPLLGQRGPAPGRGRGRGNVRRRRAHTARTHLSSGPRQGARAGPAVVRGVCTPAPTPTSPQGFFLFYPSPDPEPARPRLPPPVPRLSHDRGAGSGGASCDRSPATTDDVRARARCSCDRGRGSRKELGSGRGESGRSRARATSGSQVRQERGMAMGRVTRGVASFSGAPTMPGAAICGPGLWSWFLSRSQRGGWGR